MVGIVSANSLFCSQGDFLVFEQHAFLCCAVDIATKQNCLKLQRYTLYLKYNFV